MELGGKKMKKTSLLLIAGFIGSIAISKVHAATSYTSLEGNWKGTITANLKDEKGGGNPTQGTTGTSVEIMFNKAGTGVTGKSTIGKSTESWNIQSEKYSWNDKEITVVSKAVSFGDIPTWVRERAGLTKKDNFFAFKYEGCTVNETKKACEIGKHLPDGIDKSGIWLFKVQGNKLVSNVYYTYSSGGKRILEQSLNKVVK